MLSSTARGRSRRGALNVWRGTENKNLVFLKPLTDAQAPVSELIAEFGEPATHEQLCDITTAYNRGVAPDEVFSAMAE